MKLPMKSVITVRTRCTAAIAGAIVLLPAMINAQTKPLAAAPAAQEEVKLEKFVVTGSYIPTTGTAMDATVSPVVRIDRKIIDQSGYTTAADLLQKITASNGGSVPISNNATGFTPAASSVSLRGLGPEATLVLINGRRVAPYPVGTGGTTAFVDLNSIPLAAVETIEVLKDGASALYGADAVAGVVNIKLRKGVDGSEAFVSFGNTTDKDASETVASIITGAETANASVAVGMNYYKKESIANRDREYSAIPPFLSSNSSPLNLEVGRLAAIAAGVPVTGLPSANTFFAQSGATSSNNGQRPASAYTYTGGRSSAFNFNEFSMSFPESKRLGAFASAERKLFGTDNVKGYVDLSYQNVRTENQLAPSATGNFTGAGQVELVIPARTSTPILTVIEGGVPRQVAAGTAVPSGAIPGSGTKFINGLVQRAAVAGAFNPLNPFNQDITGGTRARFAEFGNRIYRNETDAFSIATGVKADRILGKWNVDVGYSYSQIKDTSRNSLDSISRFNRLVNAADSLFSPGSSDYSGQTTPYNPFGYYQVPIATNQTITGLAKVDTKDMNKSDLGQLTFTAATGELFELDAGGVGFAFGGDFREEKLAQYPDAAGATGDLIGSSPNAITRGQRKISGVFAETKIPILKNTRGAYDLSLDLAVRHERFLTSDRNVTVPKIGVRWQPLDRTLTVRSTFSEGFREPSLYELYSTPTSGLTPVTDPRNGSREPEQEFTVRGNRNLDAEKTKSYNVGVIYSPEAFAKGLTVGLDFWRIERDGTVEADPQTTVNNYFQNRPLEPGESVILLPSGPISVVNSVFFNVGQTEIQGVDLDAAYVIPTETMGRFEISTSFTFLDSYKKAQTRLDPLSELVGTDVTGAGEDGYLEWKGRVNLDWTFKGFNVFVSGSYLDGFEDLDVDGNPFDVESTWIFDAQVSYNFRSRFAPWLSDTKVTLGARNLFDKDPPFASGFGGNSTGYPSFLYTSENQFVYLSVGRKF
jgi:iron complex outermembrane receptor protein